MTTLDEAKAETQRRFQAEEQLLSAALLVALLAGRRKPTPHEAAALVRRRYRLAIDKAQRRAFRAGALSTLMQLRAASSLTTATPDTPAGVGARPAWQTAARAAQRMLDRALEQVELGVAPEKAFSRALRKAGKGEAQRIATTEVATSFGQAQQAVFDELGDSEDYRLARQGFDLVPAKVWNAYLDACPVCSGADGDTVFFDEGFPEGIPGSVHVNCRCYSDVTMIPANTSTPTKA